MTLEQYMKKINKLNYEMQKLDKRIKATFLKFDLVAQLNYKFTRLECRADLNDKFSEINILKLTKNQLTPLDIKNIEGAIEGAEQFVKKYNELIDRPLVT